MSATCVTHVCGELGDVPLAERQRLLDSPASRELHARLVAELAPLNQVEVRAAPPGHAERSAPRIGSWNAERCKYLGASARLLRTAGADVVLLTEMDLGMARSLQRHTVRELAEELEMGYALGIEYVELGLGDRREREWHAGETNSRGLHGAAILSRVAIERPRLIRLERSGDWFDGGRGERRIGGRMAMAATLLLAGTPTVVVSVHLESHSDPTHRAEQMRDLLQAVDEYAGECPVIVGGDFNTKTDAREPLLDPAYKAALLAAEPTRFLHPVAYEPLFATAEAAGYDWRACNVLGQPSERTRPDGTPRPPLSRLDWFFTRALTVANPCIVAAVDDAGASAISDHELLLLDIGAAARAE